MNKLEDLKKEYEALEASDALRERVEEQMKQKKNIWPRVAGIAACVIIAGGISVNVSPSLAYAMSDVPILGSFVRVVTGDKYNFNEGTYEANIEAPKLEGLLDEELQKKLNEEFAENAAAIQAAFEADMKEMQEAMGEDPGHLGVDAGYTVRTDNDKYLALDAWIVNTVGSSSTVHSFYTIDKTTGKLLTLKGLFPEGADYVTPLSDYIMGEMERRNAEEEGMFWVKDDEVTENFTTIRPDQNFFINDAGNLVICFDKYEVAAGAQGSPEFEIPKEVFDQIK